MNDEELKQYWNRLERHDWFYEYSDDHVYGNVVVIMNVN